MLGNMKRTKIEAGLYEVIAPNGLRFAIEKIFDPEVHGAVDVWKLFVAKTPDAEIGYGMDWEWCETFHRLGYAMNWLNHTDLNEVFK